MERYWNLRNFPSRGDIIQSMSEHPFSAGEQKLLVSTEETHGIEKITEKDLQEITLICAGLARRFPEKLPGFESYTGTGETVGTEDDFNNSRITLLELEYALAATRHLLVWKMSEGSVPFNADSLVQAEVMRGLKILDLGSGYKPVFARTCRHMGADAWTADKISADRFDIRDANFSARQRRLEIDRHVQL